MSAAHRLRQAAKALRALAEAAPAGPWAHVGYNAIQTTASFGENEPNPGMLCVSSSLVDPAQRDAVDAATTYAAAVGPDLGLALADWLDREALAAEHMTIGVRFPSMVVADLILGGQP